MAYGLHKGDAVSDFNGIELCGLWKNEKGTISGNMGAARLLILPNKFKEPGDKKPDYRAFVVRNEKREKQPGVPDDESMPF